MDFKKKKESFTFTNETLTVKTLFAKNKKKKEKKKKDLYKKENVYAYLTSLYPSLK